MKPIIRNVCHSRENGNPVFQLFLTALFSFCILHSAFSLSLDNAPATNITRVTATLQANVLTTNGTNPTVVIYYGFTDGVTNSTNWTYSADLGVCPTGICQAAISNLIPATYYYFRAYGSETTNSAWAPATTNFETIAGGSTNTPPGLYQALMTDTDGILITPYQFFLANSNLIIAAINYLADTNSAASVLEALNAHMATQGTNDHNNGTMAQESTNDYTKTAGFGTAAFSNASDFATAADGALAQSALQPGAQMTLHRYFSDTASNVFILASGTGIVSSLAGTTHTFVVPAGVTIISASINWDGALGSSFTFVLAEDGMNISSSTRVPATMQACRQDNGNPISGASCRPEDLVNFNKEKIYGLATDTHNLVKLHW